MKVLLAEHAGYCFGVKRAVELAIKTAQDNDNKVYTLGPLIHNNSAVDMLKEKNVFLNGALLGYSKSFMLEHLDEIIEFAELKEFIDVPLKNFSSGMAARLGFSVATIVKPDILIVDEVLAVGDTAFQDKCKLRMEEMLSNGATLIFVSHSLDQVKELCQYAIWLNKGEMLASGEVNDVANKYLNSISQ